MVLTKSKIFLYFCLSFIAGVAVASYIQIPQLISGIFLIVAIVLVMIFWRGKWKFVVLGFCLLFVVVGIWRFQTKAEVSQNDISQFNGKGRIILIGIVSEEPERKVENQRLVVNIKEVRPSTEVGLPKIEGKALVTTDKYPEYQYGNQLEIIGYLKEPENFIDESTGELFDYKSYLAKDDIYSVIYYPEIKVLTHHKGSIVKTYLFRIKSSFEENLAKILPEPQASLADGLILGERATLPEELKDDFNTVGVTHIIALSGFNITIIADSLRRFFNYLMISRQYSFWLAVVLIIAFVIMTGASASIVRAAVMGILVILAQKVGRLYSIRNALVFAGLVMIFINPKILRFDLGFQLSFLATLGLVYISPLFEKYTAWLPKTFDLRGIASATFGAQLAVLPLLLYNFGRLSLVAPLANLLILPFIPLTMFFGFVSSSLAWLWAGLGKIVGWIAWLFLSYQIKVAESMAEIPFASLNIKINWVWLIVIYILLWGIVIKMQSSKYSASPKISSSKTNKLKVKSFS